ncbi:RteC domain-containing protein [Tamlana sp. 2_MG-2023]|uniref:RteC domain-containing protein n=1 Tax=unclassified Tamlana TaxID=2614803 RepID=UPI0026E1C593|nr:MULTISPECIES: RteC domain-containing protein [unclassified Tamlana]MDO6761860.1 RteC domain-containing protein [Tamlana sp. 2_MG-2023]MDO6792631.1 RteC domain-containing protein [Tamlana sp. 1_MG-2023]
MNTYKGFLNDLNQNLECLDQEVLDVLTRSEKGIKATTIVIERLRDRVVLNGFSKQEDEKYFFKHIKPQVFSKLIYYGKLFSIESKRPRSTCEAQKQYFVDHIDKLQDYFNRNLEFYHYYRREDTRFDNQYFLRDKLDIRLHPDTFHFLSDEQFSTSHDHSVARIMAYDLLIVYLKKEIEKLEANFGRLSHAELKRSNPRLFWTGNKVDLIELIYALHASGAINRGNAGIKEIATTFETVLEMDLKDYYRTYLEIRSRKIRRTKFIDKLKDSLDQHMLDLDS